MHLNGIDERIDESEFPATTDEVVTAHGNVPIQLADGVETVGDVLARFEAETYECPADLHETLWAGVSDGAVGRRRYSDRDATAPGEDGPPQVSF